MIETATEWISKDIIVFNIANGTLSEEELIQ
jgi:hypothetical protein